MDPSLEALYEPLQQAESREGQSEHVETGRNIYREDSYEENGVLTSKSEGGEQRHVSATDSFISGSSEEQMGTIECPREIHSSSENLVSPTTAASFTSWWDKLICNYWTFEIVAIVFSIASLIAVVAVLRAYENTALHPMPYGLTLNAIVSTLATASKTSLLAAVAGVIGQLKWSWFKRDRRVFDFQSFDDATRGPAGSFSFLWNRTRKSLAAFGAAITILALSFDPFIQQILSYPIRSTHTVDNTVEAQIASKLWIPLFSLELVSAVYTGIWSDPTRLRRAPSCPSGDCWWPQISSLEWCSQCHDLRDQIEFSGDCTPHPGDNKTNCKLSLGYGEPITVLKVENHAGRYEFEWTLEVMRVVNWEPWVGSSNTSLLNHTSGSPPVTLQHLVFDDEIWAHFSEYFASKPALQNSDVRAATQCVLTPCIKTYDLLTKDNVSTKHLQSTNHGINELIHIDLPVGRQLVVCWTPDAHNADYYFVNPVHYYTGAGRTIFLNQSGPAFCALDIFSGAISLEISGASHHTMGGYYRDGEFHPSSFDYSPPNQLFRMIGAHNLSYVVNNIAASLTQYTLDASNETVAGYERKTGVESYISVRWVWIGLPLVLECLGVTLFIMTAMKSRQNGIPLWRSSLLPLFYYGFDERLALEQPSSNDRCAVEQSAKSTVVALEIVPTRSENNSE